MRMPADRHFVQSRKPNSARSRLRSCTAVRSTDETRSRIMRSVKSKDTGPERRLRSLLWNMGYRFRLHYKGLPGNPDIVMPGQRKAIFVHGCFWHCHSGCAKAAAPKTNRDYWLPKLRRNRERDRQAIRGLRALGWDVLVVWQCELGNARAVSSALEGFLGPARHGQATPRESDCVNGRVSRHRSV